MGNRAVITNKDKEEGIYVHWNGGPASICAFLTYAKAYGIRGPEEDAHYFFARLTQIIGNFFGGQLSVGVGCFKKLDTDNYDNGTYIVDNNFNVKERLFCSDYTETVTESNMRDFLKEIDKRMGINGLDDEKILDTIKFVEVKGLVIN